MRHVDFEAAMRRVAERRIEEAMLAGKFDRLPGAGRPVDLEPLPPGERAQATWWMLRILRMGGVTPDEVTLRRSIERLKQELSRARGEAEALRVGRSINALVARLNTLGTNALPGDVAGVDEAVEARRAATSARAGG